MLDTKDKVIHRIQQLSSVAAALSRSTTCKVLQLRDQLLALPEDDGYRPGGRSGLNADGAPLQYCISTSADGWNGRFISDPACIVGSSAERYRHSYDALQGLYHMTGTLGVRPTVEEMLQFHLSGAEATFESDYPDGVLWLGASPDADGLAVYMDGRRGGHQQSWDRLHAWLDHLMPASVQVRGFVEQTSQHASIMSVGLEGSTAENLRAKIYFRLLHPCPLQELGVSLLQCRELATFYNDVVGNKQIKLSGQVFNIGFHIASGKMYDAKIDLCGCDHCVGLNAIEWRQLLMEGTKKYSLAPFPITDDTLVNYCKVPYYGMGVTRHGEVRLNLYLKNKPV